MHIQLGLGNSFSGSTRKRRGAVFANKLDSQMMSVGGA